MNFPGRGACSESTNNIFVTCWHFYKINSLRILDGKWQHGWCAPFQTHQGFCVWAKTYVCDIYIYIYKLIISSLYCILLAAYYPPFTQQFRSLYARRPKSDGNEVCSRLVLVVWHPTCSYMCRRCWWRHSGQQSTSRFQTVLWPGAGPVVNLTRKSLNMNSNKLNMIAPNKPGFSDNK